MTKETEQLTAIVGAVMAVVHDIVDVPHERVIDHIYLMGATNPKLVAQIVGTIKTIFDEGTIG